MIRSSSWVLVAGVFLAACKAPSPPPPQQFAFPVFGDPGDPLAGAQVRTLGNVLATSSPDGVATFALDGRDGDTFDVAVECPSGYRSPTAPTTVTVHRLASTDRIAEYDVSCPPTTRTVVVAVKGERGHRLPVRQLGQEIGHTDASGVATVVLRTGPQEQVDLTLDTSDPENADLRPQNPAASFVVGNKDEIFVFDPHFAVAPKKAAWVARGPVRKGIPMPVRIQ
jgi:hypothetical protein